MKKIDGDSQSIRDLLSNKRYAIDYYQREYKWQRKQLQELIDDLTLRFLQDYSETDQRDAVQKYGHYFLGSIILSERDNETYIVDGQQRLTTLTLLLILLHERQGTREDAVKLADLIFAERYGKKSFNINVPDRTIFMEALFKGETFDASQCSESVQNIAARYADLDDMLPDEIDDRALPYFADWLIDNVHLVKITAQSDEDAYTIFETMNDRGLSLTPLDMLKGYLLNAITDPAKRSDAATIWRKRLESLRELGRDEDSDAVKTWLRAKYAQTVRDRHRGAENKDFERIGTEFHRWLRDNSDAVGLKTPDAYHRFVHRDFDFYTRLYERLHKASAKLTPGLEVVHYIARAGFTLQYPLFLSAVRADDAPATVERKIRIVGTFLDILIARRAVNYLSLTFGAMSYYIFLVIKDVRDQSETELAQTLHDRLDKLDCTFDKAENGRRTGMRGFYLNHWSKRYIKWLLARMTDYVERQSGQPSHFSDYMADGKSRFEVEHIWADKYDRHRDEFAHPSEFADYRNKIGGLLLLPKSFNASFGALTYAEKLPHYNAHNLLARSLNPQCYDHNPGFLRFVENSGLPFRPMNQFGKAVLDERVELYHKLAEQVWNPQQLHQEAQA